MSAMPTWIAAEDSRMSAKPPSLTRRAVKGLFYVAAFSVTILLTVVLVFALQARSRLPDLRAWHRIQLDQEFRAGHANAPASFRSRVARAR